MLELIIAGTVVVAALLVRGLAGFVADLARIVRWTWRRNMRNGEGRR